MLDEFLLVGDSDPKISKSAELKLIQHVVQNKKDLNHLLKLFITIIEPVMGSPSTGCLVTLSNSLNQGKVNPLELADLMDKCLLPCKESSNEERNHINFARILCIGLITKTTPSITSELAKGVGFLPSALQEMVELSQMKSTYFLLSLTFLGILLRENRLSQEAFNTLVWPSISVLFASTDDNVQAEKGNEAESDDLGGNWKWVKFCCQVQLALDCKMMGYKTDFECLEDPGKIAKGLLASNLQFEESFLHSFFKHLAVSSDTDQIKTFWEKLVDSANSTHFELLCLSVKTSIQAGLPISGILSKKLVWHLLNVFKLGDRKDLHKKSRETIGSLLQWAKCNKDTEVEGRDESTQSLSKKERNAMLDILFDAEEPPSILHECKFLHPIIRPFIAELTSQELEHIQGIIMTKLFDSNEKPKLISRMSITYLQILGHVAHCHMTGLQLRLKIAEKLLIIGFGRESVTNQNKPGSSPRIREQTKKCTVEALHLILSSNYSPEFVTLLSSYITQNLTEFTNNPETVKVFKDIEKVDTGGRPYLDFILRSYGIRVLLDEGQLDSSSGQNFRKVLELVKGCTDGDFTQLWKFVTNSLGGERYPPFNYVGLFNKLLVEGKVKLLFVEGGHMGLGRNGDKDDEDDEWDGERKEIKMEIDNAEEDEEDSDSTTPPETETKFDLTQTAKLKAEMGAAADSDGSIAPDAATEDRLQRMDHDWANIPPAKMRMKNENHRKGLKCKGSYRCPTCSKGFKQRLHLQWHLNTHTGSKPYICESCGKGFTQPSSLKTHFHSFHT